MQTTDEGKYRVGMVARLTGLSTHVLRVWEKRYEAVVPARTPKGGRLYSDADVKRLKLLANLVNEGHSIGAIANLDDPELEKMLRKRPEPEPDDAVLDVTAFRERFLERILALDIRGAEQMLGKAAIAFEPRRLVQEVIGPILVEVGDRWERGELRVAHEHTATAMLRGLLGSLMRIYGSNESALTAVAATPAGDLHELGALMAAMMAAIHGFQVIYLGPNLPAEEIHYAVNNSKARLLLLSISGLEESEAESETRAIVDGLSRDVWVIVGGRAAPDGCEEMGCRKLPDFGALDHVLTDPTLQAP